MKIIDYLENKIGLILLNASFLLLISIYFKLLHISTSFLLLFIGIWSVILGTYLLLNYLLLKKRAKEIIQTIDHLDEKYLICEIIKKPKNLENYAYYYALKKACKSMNDKLGILKKQRENYQSYIECFVHEIKTPISALSLISDNEKNEKEKKEILKMNNLVEQILYYSRSNNPEKDYFIKELSLEEIVHHTIMNFKSVLLKQKIHLEVFNLHYLIFCDEKWLQFIFNQIIQNSIKYLDKKEKRIKIYAEKEKEKITLIIEDNGIGIKKNDLSRVFDFGFTGSDRKKEYSTGMGLYICKNLCEKLNLSIIIDSEEKKFTKVKIIFPSDEFKNLNL